MLQSKGTRKGAQALNKWLDWDEVLEARSRFEMARSRKERAREACDLLSIATFRPAEVRTLQIIQEAELSEPFAATNLRNRNFAITQKEGDIILHLQD